MCLFCFWLHWLFVAVHGLFTVACGLSLIVVRGLSCPVACEIFLDWGSNPSPLHRQVGSTSTDHQGSPVSLLKDSTCKQYRMLLVFA